MKKIIKLVAGAMLFASALWGYHNSVKYMYEMTFISNFCGGIILLVDGFLELTAKKSLPVIVYQFFVICLNVVFCTCFFKLFGWHDFNFRGAFFFLHAINPPAFFLAFLFCTHLNIKNKSDYLARVFASPLVIMSYLLFDFVRYTFTGKFVYGLVPTEKINAFTVPFIGIGFYLLMAFMAYGIIELKLYVQKKFGTAD